MGAGAGREGAGVVVNEPKMKGCGGGRPRCPHGRVSAPRSPGWGMTCYVCFTTILRIMKIPDYIHVCVCVRVCARAYM